MLPWRGLAALLRSSHWWPSPRNVTIPSCIHLKTKHILACANLRYDTKNNQLRYKIATKISQCPVLLLFTSLGLSHFIYGLPVYGASEPDLNIIQNFSDRCHKRRCISYPVSIKDLLKKQDSDIFMKVTSTNN